MVFLEGQPLKDKVRYVLAGDNVNCAVAFWGMGAEAYFQFGDPAKKVRIICNLDMGGTNPKVIRLLLLNHSVKQSDLLHAKVYISDLGAVIGSANMSINGLGVEGNSGAKWEEAAIFTNDETIIREVRSWFDNLETNEISADDLERAQKKFDTRKLVVSNEDVRALEFPVFTWWGHDDAKLDSSKFIGKMKLEIENESGWEYGISCNSNDAKFCLLNDIRLVVFDLRDKIGIIQYFDVRSMVGGAVNLNEAGDFIYDNRKMKKLSRLESNFLNQRIFSEDYKEIRDEDYKGEYIKDRLPAMRELWKEFKEKFPDSKLNNRWQQSLE
jgi:hypothetical protein